MISIIIPIYNPENLSFKNEKFLRPQLESLIKYTDLSNVEIILIVNGYTPKTIMVITNITGYSNKFKIWYFKEPLGYTRAANEGMKQAKGDFIILLNDDVILLNQPKNYWINKLLEPFINPKIGITGCHKLKCPITNEDFIVGYCMCIKKEVIDKIGYYNEIFSPGYGEDIDYCLRAKKEGFLIQEVGGQYKQNNNLIIGNYPLFHEGEVSFSSFNDILEGRLKNEQILFDKKLKGCYS